MKVPPPTEADEVKMLHGIKERYEKFHGVSYTDEAIRFSVSHANRYLPGKAVDVLDAAAAGAKVRQTWLVAGRHRGVAEADQVHGAPDGNAIANHEFEKARFYSDEERKERENLKTLREKYHLDESSAAVVGREDIEEVISNC